MSRLTLSSAKRRMPRRSPLNSRVTSYQIPSPLRTCTKLSKMTQYRLVAINSCTTYTFLSKYLQKFLKKIKDLNLKNWK